MGEEKTLELQVDENGPTCPFCKMAQSRNGKILIALFLVVIPALILLYVILQFH